MRYPSIPFRCNGSVIEYPDRRTNSAFTSPRRVHIHDSNVDERGGLDALTVKPVYFDAVERGEGAAPALFDNRTFAGAGALPWASIRAMRSASSRMRWERSATISGGTWQGIVAAGVPGRALSRNTCRQEAHALAKSRGSLELLVGLAWKADDDISRKARRREPFGECDRRGPRTPRRDTAAPCARA